MSSPCPTSNSVCTAILCFFAAQATLGGAAQAGRPEPAPRLIVAAAPPAHSDAIDALFFGSGPLRPSDGATACPFMGFWSGFPRGTTVTVRVSTTVSEDKRDAIRRALDQVFEATRGAIATMFELTEDPDPVPSENQVTSTSHPSPSGQGCVSDVGCTIHSFEDPGVFRSSRAVQPPGQTVNAYVHDVIGHGILGMCHIDGNLIGGSENSLMSGGPGVFSGAIALELTPLDIEALNAAYGSSLDPGAVRRDFVAEGLVDP